MKHFVSHYDSVLLCLLAVVSIVTSMESATAGETVPSPDDFVPFQVAPQPLPDFSPQPAFPDSARQVGEQGMAVVQAYVDTAGEVKKWKIVEEQPAGLGFGDEVLKIIPNWKFSPALQQDQPVGVWVAIPFNFVFPSELTPRPLPDFCPEPAFPEQARQAGVQGRVVVTAFVDKKGNAKKWKIAAVQPSGLGFEEEVALVFPKWKFMPPIRKGKPVGMWVAIPFNFTYRDGKAITGGESVLGDQGEDESQHAEEIAQDSIPSSGAFVPFEVPPQPFPDFSPRPAFPAQAKSPRAEGRVVVQVYIDKQGAVKRWKVVEETPAGEGYGEEVLKIIPEWKFMPAMQGGEPIGVWIAIPFNFRYSR